MHHSISIQVVAAGAGAAAAALVLLLVVVAVATAVDTAVLVPFLYSSSSSSSYLLLFSRQKGMFPSSEIESFVEDIVSVALREVHKRLTGTRGATRTSRTSRTF